jgi:hypothetical protein
LRRKALKNGGRFDGVVALGGFAHVGWNGQQPVFHRQPSKQWGAVSIMCDLSPTGSAAGHALEAAEKRTDVADWR